ncbi:unnamed protein product [Leptosia nina]|uniref:Single domain-containing protein n=1 Tax=Leptosia nina TaxID=320188 RepID=A0AAV1JKR9_9NEOP
MNKIIVFIATYMSAVSSGPPAKNYKDQFCVDPRTMEKHEVYQEWADAYSCTRHRCQPGGRNLAIYTVGCKRVEAPESAIECEEVVEDTNMQFPYCCTRLRCLVVVRGEVWTKVLGQPWESLPAAPWSHMYKMKKPPPIDELPKNAVQGPIYEIQTEHEEKVDKVLRASKKTTESPDCQDMVPRAAASPDIVIALTTGNDEKEHKQIEALRRKRPRKSTSSPYLDDNDKEHNLEVEDSVNEKVPAESDEKYFDRDIGVTQKIGQETHQGWTALPHDQWNEHDVVDNTEPPQLDRDSEDRPDKATGLQALVDAIGNRMRDIENVVQKMSEKVHQKVEPAFTSLETRPHVEGSVSKHHVAGDQKVEYEKQKKPSPDSDYKRFSVKNRSRYLAGSTETPIEQPLFVEDTVGQGYFSDASNSIMRRINPPKEPATYMAPVETRRKHTDSGDDSEKHKKKHTHKKKHGKGKGHHKHHGKDDKRKHFNKLASNELDKNIVSLEDSSTNK